MKKTIYIYIESNTNEPEVHMSVESALESMIADLKYHAERWDYDEDDLNGAIKELKEDASSSANDHWFGTYLGELSVNCYVREIEI